MSQAGSIFEEELKQYLAGEADLGMELLDERGMQADCFTYLLLDEVVSKASDLKIVVHLGIHGDNHLANGHLREASRAVDPRVHVQLIKDQ